MSGCRSLGIRVASNIINGRMVALQHCTCPDNFGRLYCGSCNASHPRSHPDKVDYCGSSLLLLSPFRMICSMVVLLKISVDALSGTSTWLAAFRKLRAGLRCRTLADHLYILKMHTCYMFMHTCC
jgi:hypothetical protein